MLLTVKMNNFVHTNVSLVGPVLFCWLVVRRTQDARRKEEKLGRVFAGEGDVMEEHEREKVEQNALQVFCGVVLCFVLHTWYIREHADIAFSVYCAFCTPRRLFGVAALGTRQR